MPSIAQPGKSLRPKLIGNIVRNWFADRRPPPEAFEDVHPDLLPSVRSRAYFEFAKLQLRLEHGAGESDYPLQVLADHLAIGLVYDLPDSMRTIVRQDLEGWGVTFFERWKPPAPTFARKKTRCSSARTRASTSPRRETITMPHE